MTLIPESIKQDAAKAYKAMRNRDWSLHGHISRRYYFGTPEREMFNKAMADEAEQYQQANPPQYFA